jgi:protein-S-isoprenylcysteine O-methyltransferase Ste14
MKTFVKWSKKEYPLTTKVLASLLAGVLFLGLIPCILLNGLPRLEDWLGLPAMPSSRALTVIAVALIVVGAPIGFGTVLTQFIKARGTPIPIMPTENLLTGGLYAWSRNPMVFGTLTAYLGLSLLSASWSSLIIAFLFALFLILYLKLIEERELEARFGQAYLDYKRNTSFIIPWPRKKY